MEQPALVHGLGDRGRGGGGSGEGGAAGAEGPGQCQVTHRKHLHVAQFTNSEMLIDSFSLLATP